jgi:two-component sensor histidine kinase
MLTLCLHELATNAAKYGALSNGTGQVHIAWQPIDNAGQRRVRLSWWETGGPPVKTPSHKGFGSLLIESSFASEGASSIEFLPGGLRCVLELAV